MHSINLDEFRLILEEDSCFDSEKVVAFFEHCQDNDIKKIFSQWMNMYPQEAVSFAYAWLNAMGFNMGESCLDDNLVQTAKKLLSVLPVSVVLYADEWITITHQVLLFFNSMSEPCVRRMTRSIIVDIVDPLIFNLKSSAYDLFKECI